MPKKKSSYVKVSVRPETAHIVEQLAELSNDSVLHVGGMALELGLPQVEAHLKKMFTRPPESMGSGGGGGATHYPPSVRRSGDAFTAEAKGNYAAKKTANEK